VEENAGLVTIRQQYHKLGRFNSFFVYGFVQYVLSLSPA